MYTTVKRWADKYAPLTHQEELEATKGLDTTTSLTLLLKHNARGLIKTVTPWRHTYTDLNDAMSVVVLALVKAYRNYDCSKSGFWYWARLRVSAALHRYKPNRPTELDIDELEVADDNAKVYSDLNELLQTSMRDLFTDREREFLLDVYYRGLSVKEAGTNYGYQVGPSKSRKHKELLTRLREDLGTKYDEGDTPTGCDGVTQDIQEYLQQ